MKGFLIKDCRLLTAQKNLLIILPVGLLLMFTNDTPVMGISYTLYVIAFLSNSLMAYDSFDNGMAFLMTMPGGRKNYVTEKYLFNIVNATCTAIVLVLIAAVLELSRGHGVAAVKELLLGTWMLYMIALIFSFVMLPIQLKFGHEKSRVILMLFFGIVFLGSMGLGKIAEMMNINPDAVFAKLNEISLGSVIAVICVLMLICAIVSWCISQNIMKKKSF